MKITEAGLSHGIRSMPLTIIVTTATEIVSRWQGPDGLLIPPRQPAYSRALLDFWQAAKLGAKAEAEVANLRNTVARLTAEVDIMANNELRPRLAVYAHAAWSGWMRYLFANAIINADGTATIPARLVARWTRQMRTAYGDLSPADQILTVIGAEDHLEPTALSTVSG